MRVTVRTKNGGGRWRVEVIDVACVSGLPRYAKVKGGIAAGKPWWVPIGSLEVF